MKKKKTFLSFLYLLVLIAVCAALVFVIGDNRKRRAERSDIKKTLASQEENLKQEFLETKQETQAATEDAAAETEKGKAGTEDSSTKSTAEPDTSEAVTDTETHTQNTDGETSTTESSDSSESTDVETSTETTSETETASETETESETEKIDQSAKILVLNGTLVEGVATYWKNQLEEAGFTNVTAATYNREIKDETVIYGKEEDQKAFTDIFPNAESQKGSITVGIEYDNTADSSKAPYDYYILIGMKDIRRN